MRWKYINQTNDALQNADEVWSTQDDNKTFKRYVKYYQSKPLFLAMILKTLKNGQCMVQMKKILIKT